jgi:hypothetical protein
MKLKADAGPVKAWPGTRGWDASGRGCRPPGQRPGSEGHAPAGFARMDNLHGDDG